MLGCWWIQFQIGDTFEMARIVGQDGQIMMQGGGSNQHIKIRDKLTSPTEQGTNFRKLFNDRKIKIEQLKVAKK